MQNKNHKGRRPATGRPVGNPTATSQVYTPEQRETLRVGLRILATIIARAHLRRRAERSSAAAPGLPPDGAGERAIPETGGDRDG